MTSRRELREALRSMGSTPTAPPGQAFVARLELELRHLDAVPLVSARRPAARPGPARRPRLSMRVVVISIGATFATAAAAAAFVLAQPPNRLHVESPAEEPTVVVTTAAPVVTSSAISAPSSSTVPPSSGPLVGPSPSTSDTLGAATTSTTAVPTTSAASTSVAPAIVPVTTTEIKRATTAPSTTSKATDAPHPTTTDGPRPPTTITATCTGRNNAGVRTILCEWSEAAGAASYRILRGDGRAYSTPSGTRRLEDPNVVGDVTYTYLITALASDGTTVLAISNRPSVACCLPV